MSAKHTIPGPRGPEKDPSWFSWRHATRDEHDAAREAWLSEHGPGARCRKAVIRQDEFDLEVRDAMREFNEPEPEARRVVRSRHYAQHIKALRHSVVTR